MEKDKFDILELLISHELAIKELYEIYATLFTSHKIFWQNIAADEKRHADMLIALRPNENLGRWLQYENRLRPQAIKTSLGYVESQISRAKGGNTNLMQALSIAKDIENALIERHFSKIKYLDPDEIGLVLATLAKETARHLKTIIEMIYSEKR